MHPKKAEMEQSLLNCRPALLTSSGHTGTFILNQFGRCLQGDQRGCRTGNEGEVSNSWFDDLLGCHLVSLHFMCDIVSGGHVDKLAISAVI